METTNENFIRKLEELITKVNHNLIIAQENKCEESSITTLLKILELCNEIINILKGDELKLNYLLGFNLWIQNIERILVYHPLNTNHKLAGAEKIRETFSNLTPRLLSNYDPMSFNLDFFKKTLFFNKNIVAIGANGSGKTLLSRKFQDSLKNNGVVIPAQRILFIKEFEFISNPNKTSSDLKENQKTIKTNKTQEELLHLRKEFAVVLNNLLSENTAIGNKFRKESIESKEEGKEPPIPPKTNLDLTLEIWNSLIIHRQLSCEDGVNIVAEYSGGRSYNIGQLSEGEKVILYLISHVLQAPRNGFIVIDEPEMYLHKTIITKLYNELEKHRSDCLFIYLTHDLEFAASRNDAKKIWIKSYQHQGIWHIENIENDEIPEQLLIELLGSNKNLLFCEGTKGSIDEKIYNILFPHFTIIPTGNCFQVINQTKAFNRLRYTNTKAFGLIDSDNHSAKRLSAIKKDNIYSFNVVEPENLLLDEDFLLALAQKNMKGETEVDNIKNEVIEELKKDKEFQVSNYISARIDYYFKDSNLKKGNNLEQIKSNYELFNENIKIQEWYNERVGFIDKIVEERDFRKALSIFNHKGLKNIVNRHFRIGDFTDRAIKLLLTDSNTHPYLIKYFPDEIKNKE